MQMSGNSSETIQLTIEKLTYVLLITYQCAPKWIIQPKGGTQKKTTFFQLGFEKFIELKHNTLA